MSVASVKDIRNFKFSDKPFKVREVLDSPDLSMDWTWTDFLCPHCHQKTTNTQTHSFYAIEILGDSSKEDGDLAEEDLVILGHSYDKRLMKIPKDNKTYNEVLKKSSLFNKFSKEV
jgi:hypothetical protein